MFFLVDESVACQISDYQIPGWYNTLSSSVFINILSIIIQVIDARDPQGTRCYHLEKHLKENCKHKHLVLLLNKVTNFFFFGFVLNCSKYHTFVITS